MALRLFARSNPKACATCGTPVDEGAIEAHEKLFHSNLCLRKYERDAKRTNKSKKGGGGGGCGGCH